MKNPNYRMISILLALLLIVSSVSYAFGGQSLGSRTLKQGMSGDDIITLQKILMERSYAIGSATGYFGPKTLEAVKLFQRDNGLVPDGIVGPKTFTVLFKIMEAGNGPTAKYTVRAGDTLFNIAKKNNTTISGIKAANNLVSDNIYPGQVLTIPGGSQSPPGPTPGPIPDDSSFITHQVVSGDTLYLVAKKYGTNVEEIKKVNSLVSDVIYVGQALKIPQNQKPPVSPPVNEPPVNEPPVNEPPVNEPPVNPLPDPPAAYYPEVVTVRDSVTIHSGADLGQPVIISMVKGVRLPVISVSGHWYEVRLYNNSRGWVFRDDVTGKTPGNLPSRNVIGFYTDAEEPLVSSFDTMTSQADKLTSVAPFWFQIDAKDAVSLIPFGNFTEDNARKVVNEAHRRNIKVLALVHNLLYKNGVNSRDVMENLLSTEESRKKFIENVLQVIDNYGFDGVNIDTEYVKLTDRDKLPLLMKELKEALTPKGYVLTISIPGKMSDDLDNNWSGPFDYAAIGQHADQVVVMMYLEHGYPGSPPGPISSSGFIEKILQFTVTKIPREKIVAALPVFGSDFYLDGQDNKSLYLSFEQVMERARIHNATVIFDETSKTPMFRYTNSLGQRREVWFDNAASISHKIDLINKWNLDGFALWRMGMEDPMIWQVIDSKVNVEK